MCSVQIMHIFFPQDFTNESENHIDGCYIYKPGHAPKLQALDCLVRGDLVHSGYGRPLRDYYCHSNDAMQVALQHNQMHHAALNIVSTMKAPNIVVLKPGTRPVSISIQFLLNNKRLELQNLQPDVKIFAPFRTSPSKALDVTVQHRDILMSSSILSQLPASKNASSACLTHAHHQRAPQRNDEDWDKDQHDPDWVPPNAGFNSQTDDSEDNSLDVFDDDDSDSDEEEPNDDSILVGNQSNMQTFNTPE
jgi:hypothetical protein